MAFLAGRRRPPGVGAAPPPRPGSSEKGDMGTAHRQVGSRLSGGGGWDRAGKSSCGSKGKIVEDHPPRPAASLFSMTILAHFDDSGLGDGGC